MTRVELTVAVPDALWVGDVSRRFSEATFRVVTAFADDEAGVGLVEIVAAATDPILDAVAAHDTVRSLDVLYEGNDEVLAQFETGDPVLLFPLRESGIPLEFPFEIRDGEATWTIHAPADRVSALREQLDAFGITFTLEHIEQEFDRDDLLTDRQKEVVTTAINEGYYKTPRECTLTELADAVGIAKSTCSETLHRAEAAIVTEFAERTDLLS